MLLYFITMHKKDDKFNEFWNLYPRKVKKFVARRIFNRLSKKDIEDIFNVYKDHLIRWKETELQYVPHASTWLNQRRWEDELEPLPKKELSSDDYVEKKAREFRLMMEEADRNKATEDEIKEALGLK